MALKYFFFFFGGGGEDLIVAFGTLFVSFFEGLNILAVFSSLNSRKADCTL